MTTVDAREHFAEVVNRAAYGKERIELVRRGKRVAVVVPVEDVELLERLEAAGDLADARAALAEEGEDVPLATFRAEQGI